MPEDRVTIRKVIERVRHQFPEALDIPDTAFLPLFDDCAKQGFGVADPEHTWQRWSVERTRKKIKAERRATSTLAGIRATARSRFLAMCSQYAGSLRSIIDIPDVFDNGIEELVQDSQKHIDSMETEATAQAASLLQEMRESRSELQRLNNELVTRARAAAPHVWPSAFVYLVATLDSFIADSLSYLYRIHPKQMQGKAQGADLTQRELKELKKVPYDWIFDADSLDELTEKIVEKEVRLVTGEDTRRQIECLGRLGVDVGSMDTLAAGEFTAARNVYVHNGGRMNGEYFRRTASYWESRGGCPHKLGDSRPVDYEYCKEVLDWALNCVRAVRAAVEKTR